jgi:hypothetical protein
MPGTHKNLSVLRLEKHLRDLQPVVNRGLLLSALTCAGFVFWAYTGRVGAAYVSAFLLGALSHKVARVWTAARVIEYEIERLQEQDEADARAVAEADPDGGRPAATSSSTRPNS